MRVCRLEDILPDTGVCALVDGDQVAVFRIQDEIHAVGNRDPFSRANVLSRGIVGDVKGELVVASPVYKQRFSLRTGRCLEDATVRIPVYAARVDDGFVHVQPAKQVSTTCCYCGVGCGVVVSVSRNEIFSLKGDARHPANFGRLCTKGAALHLSTDPAARLLYPEVNGERASWDEALGFAANRFAEIIAAHGPDAVAFYISGQLLTEDYYVFNKLAKGLIGTNNVDTNSRLCMSSAVAGYKMSLGADAPPCAYEDIDAADLILIAGSNTAFAHPIVWHRIEAARAKNPDLKVIVIDPRATVTARAADLHLALAPGTDVALFSAMLFVLQQESYLDKDFIEAHTEGYENFEPWTPERAAETCGLPAAQIVQAARMFGSAKAALSLYCQGLNQSTSGTFKNSALINLHLATGQIGKPGAGPFSLTGQPNAMGGREVGGMANLLSAHRELSNPKHRKEVADLWGVRSVPERPGRTAVELFDAVGRGEIKAVWIACTNPAQSMPDVSAVRKALERAELVVVQDAFRDAETCAYADVLLPATTWAEKEGTVTNSERRISRVRAAVAPPGEARPDWQIAVDFARRLQQVIPAKAGIRFAYQSPEEIFNEHRETTRARDLDITGLSYALLERDGPQQWPYPEGATSGRTRLYTDGVFPTPAGRARFVATEYTPPAEAPDADYPISLTTGRLRDQWHSMTRTGLVARLFSHSPEPEILISQETLSTLNLQTGSLVRVSSRRGSIVLKARASSDMRPGDAFVAMHWGSQFTSARTNVLTIPAIDPHSKQPELKHAAVRIEPFTARWRGTFTAPASPDIQRAAAAFLDRFDYAAFSLAEGPEILLRLDLASSTDRDPKVLSSLEQLFGSPADTSPSASDRAVCACFKVPESAIRSAVAAGATLANLQEELKCGTNCGSCVPELRRFVGAVA